MWKWDDLLDRIPDDSALAGALLAEPAEPNEIKISTRDRNSKTFFQPTAHQLYTLWVCTEGTGDLLVEGATFRFAGDEAMLVLPGQPHLRKADPARPGKWLLITFSLPAAPRWIIYFRCRQMRLGGEARHWMELFLQSYAEYAGETSPVEAVRTSHLLGLLLNSLRQPEQLGFTPAAVGVGADSPESSRLQQAYLLLLKHFNHEGAERLTAAELKMSVGYFRRLFRASFGMTPSRFLRTYRVFAARQLLLYSSLNVTEIARRCGFRSLFAFSRFFAAECGRSPLSYRRRWRDYSVGEAKK